MSNFIVFLVPILYFISSCISPQYDDTTPYGLTPKKEGYIPARTGLIPCMVWPERSTRIKGLPLSNVGSEDNLRLCDELNQFVAAGFDNQPYMKGLSPKLVEKLYSSIDSSIGIAGSINREWSHQSSDCQQCRTLAAFYNSSISNRQNWQLWLTQFSKATKGADAILIPFILYFDTNKGTERGLIIAQRRASVGLLLIDTSSGELIWSGGREATVTAKAYEDSVASAKMEVPTMDELKIRLFTDAIFENYPGRKVYK